MACTCRDVLSVFCVRPAAWQHAGTPVGMCALLCGMDAVSSRRSSCTHGVMGHLPPLCDARPARRIIIMLVVGSSVDY